MHKWMLLAAPAAMLAGCNTVTEGMVKANQTVQNSFYQAAEQVQGWTSPAGINTGAAPAPQTGFCYKSLGDIVCYAQPQPTMTNQLFAYQGYTQSPEAQLQAAVTPNQAVVVGGEIRRQIVEVRPAKQPTFPSVDPVDVPRNRSVTNVTAYPISPVIDGGAPVAVGQVEAAPSDPVPLMPRF